MQISQLRAFVAAVAAGGVGAGARSIGMAQPTLTRAIKQLEAELGATLLARGPSGMVLTQFGRQLLPHALRIVTSHGKIQETGRQLRGEGVGEVCVAASAVPRFLLFPRASAALRAHFPQVRLTVAEAVYPQILHHFERGSIDFAICPVPSPLPEAGLAAEPILRTHLAIAMRKNHPMAACTTLAELRSCAWIASGPAHGLGLPELFADHGLPAPDCHIQCESVECALRLVAATNLLTLAPRLLIERGAAEGRLAHPKLSELGITKPISLVTHPGRVMTPAAAHFCASIRAAARAVEKRGGTPSAARPPEGASAPSGGSAARAAGKRGGLSS